MNRNQMQMIQQMQNRMLKMQEELGEQTVEGTAGGGAVKVEVSGHQEVRSITINKEVVDPEDVETLQDLVLVAVNDGLRKSQELAQQKMAGVTGNLKIPGIM
ncbi:MAG TPA: YbaB/EbfC family nucleoid-associated protein [Chloroflexota bacterium]|nr:YbaB/EbfC family nucleoid-associated protein [Chloroflexota bacterium]